MSSFWCKPSVLMWKCAWAWSKCVTDFFFFFSFPVDKNTDGNTSQILRDMSACWQTLPKVSFPVVQGNMVHGCYSPLSKSQLEWHISINDITKEVEKEQSEIMQARLSLSSPVIAVLNALIKQSDLYRCFVFLWTGSRTRDPTAVWELRMDGTDPFVYLSVESSLIGIHEGSACVSVRGEH